MHSPPEHLTPEQVAQAVTQEMGGTPAAIFAPTRGTPAVALRRWAAMWVWRRLSDPHRTFTETGRAFGRDRTAVSGGERRLREMTAGCPPLARITRRCLRASKAQA